MKAGFSLTDVSPGEGAYMAGFWRRTRPSKGTWTPLYARCAYVEAGRSRIAIVAADLIGLSLESVNRIRRLCNKLCRIPEDNVMVACTHNHSGPYSVALTGRRAPDPDYLRRTEKKIAAAVASAARNKTRCLMGFGRGRLDGYSVNRRGEEIVDPEVAFAVFTDRKGKPLGLLANYACHPTVLNAKWRYISYEFPGVMCKTLEDVLGRDVVPVFINGCCGNVKPSGGGSDWREAETFGRGPAGEILKASRGISLSGSERLASASTRVQVPLERIFDMAQLKRMSCDGKGFDRLWAKEVTKAYGSEASFPRTRALEVQAIAIGDVAIVGFPGQMFCQFGLRLKKRLKAKNLLIANQANDQAGYFCTKEAWRRGGYEVAQAYRFNSLSPGPVGWRGSERLYRAALHLLSREGM